VTAHPCSGPGWTRIPGGAVESYVLTLPYQERRTTRFGGIRQTGKPLYRSEATGAHYRAEFVDAVFQSRPRGSGATFKATELERRDEGLREPVRAIELTWTSPERGPGRVLLHEVSLL
jgi:hypothetical protein